MSSSVCPFRYLLDDPASLSLIFELNWLMMYKEEYFESENEIFNIAYACDSADYC